MIYKENAEKYLKKGIHTLPTSPGTKACYITGYGEDFVNEDYIHSLIENKKYSNHGVGIRLGEFHNLEVIDIDTDDKNLQLIIDNFMKDYPTPLIRVGDKERLPARFYQWSGGRKQTTAQNAVERLAEGQLVVLPPTIHKNGYAYEWGKNSLLDINVDDLPIFSNSAWDKLCDIVSGYYGDDVKGKTVITKAHGRCNHGSHNKLSEVLKACIFDGKSESETIEQLILRDFEINKDVSYFECPTRKWKHSKETNVAIFVAEGFLRSLKNGEIKSIAKKSAPITIVDKEIIKPKIKKYPHLRGVGDEIFNYVYNNSSTPRGQFSFASTIALASTVFANKVKYGRSMSNTYIMLTCPSAGGKDDPLEFPKNALIKAGFKHMVGTTNPASDTSVISSLSDFPERIDIIDEASKLFKAFKSQNTHQAGIQEAYTQLFSAAGRHFMGKYAESYKKEKGSEDGWKGQCESPCVSLMCAMTVDAFQKEFDASMMNQGFGGRFFWFFDPSLKAPVNETREQDPIPESITNWITHWRGDDSVYNLGPMRLGQSRDAAEMIAEIKKNKADPYHLQNNGILDPLLKRYTLLLNKLILIDACFMNGDKLREGITVTTDNVQWATDVLDVNLYNASLFLEGNLHDSKRDFLLQVLLDAIEEQGASGCTKTIIRKKYEMKNLNKKELTSLLEILMERGEIIFNEHNAANNKKVSTFFHKNYIKY